MYKRQDLICTSDYMVERLISEGEVNKIDFSSFSNYQNIDPSIIDGMTIYTDTALKEYLEPVSYTHLDVYKRQVYCILRRVQQGK